MIDTNKDIRSEIDVSSFCEFMDLAIEAPRQWIIYALTSSVLTEPLSLKFDQIYDLKTP